MAAEGVTTTVGTNGHQAETPLLDVVGLTVGYGNQGAALRNVSISVAPGAAVALLGTNGAGKTTLIRAISGLLRLHDGRVHSGHIAIDGKSVVGLAAHTIVRRGIAQVPEGRLIFPSLSVAENLKVGAATKRRPGLVERLDQVYELFPVLYERRRQHAGLMSGGEQQMISVGRALMSNPRLLLLDEVSLGLAPKAVEAIFDRLATVRRSLGMAMLIVEQNATSALALADHAYVLETGQVRLQGSSEVLRANDEIRQAYLGLPSETGGQASFASRGMALASELERWG